MHTAQTKLILYLVVQGSYIKGSLGIGDWSGLRGHDVLQVMCHDIGVGVMYHVMGHGSWVLGDWSFVGL